MDAAEAVVGEAEPGLRARVLVPAVGLAASAVLLFGLQERPAGYGVLVLALVVAWWAGGREVGTDLSLIGVGIAIVGTTSVEADVSWPRYTAIGLALTLAVAAPLAIDRLVLRRRVIRFPWRAHRRLPTAERAYLVAVPLLGWAILPFYFIRSGSYQNWPDLVDGGELARFFVGVNAVGTWDELFFIATCFALLRRHLPVWPANLVQAAIFVSFLWELGYRSWGPALTIPFALLQGWLYARTRSLGYVVAVHLLFDAIVFLAIVHAHDPSRVPIFVY